MIELAPDQFCTCGLDSQRTEQVAAAQRDALRNMLELVLAELVDRKQHMAAKKQRVLDRAMALLEELRG